MINDRPDLLVSEIFKEIVFKYLKALEREEHKI
jgi:hypothetical protein